MSDVSPEVRVLLADRRAQYPRKKAIGMFQLKWSVIFTAVVLLIGIFTGSLGNYLVISGLILGVGIGIISWIQYSTYALLERVGM